MAKSILIIEDDEFLANLLRKKLVSAGYEVFVSSNGQDGLKQIEAIMPKLLLLDIILPDVNGFHIMEKLQMERKLKKIPVIIISNSGQPVDLYKAKRLGAKDWLIKTEFDPQEVQEKVRKQIGR